ncbi:hypothetical protein [Aquimarina agarilytica]|uniref:hypothetical protein n=1 Tax=Aquimarina agarilytica TaxID=1087449 RepID=UPI000288CA40|nr:hypothetical protein [Aquimarina agarilytica]
MKSTPEYDHIDFQFIKAVDEIIEVNKKLGLKPINDSALGTVIYPTNRSIISAVRNRQKHIPHMALINLAKEFTLDMNYFYSNEATPLNYQPKTLNNIHIHKNGISSTGDNAMNIHAGKGKIKRIHTAEAGSKNTLVETVNVNNMINHFISNMDNERVKQFMNIIASIQSEHKATSAKMEAVMNEKSAEMKEIKNTFKDELKSVKLELKETREKLDASVVREMELLRKMIEQK